MKNNSIKFESNQFQKIQTDLKQLKSPEGFLYASNSKFKTLFGRDSLISSWQMIGIDNTIAKNTLKILSKYQGKELNKKKEEELGKIMHEYRKNKREILNTNLAKRTKNIILKYWDFPYYGSIDSTPLFIIILVFYYRETKDSLFVRKLIPNLEKALNWIIYYADKNKNGFIAYQRINPHGLFHQGWKDRTYDSLHIKPPVSLVEVQGYAYKALKEGAWLYRNFIRNNKKSLLLNQNAENLKNKFNKIFWLPDKKFYAFALDGNNKQIKSVTSNVGHCLFTGIIDKSHEKEIVKRLFAKDIFTDYGIRTLSSEDKNFDEKGYHWGAVWPHDNWIIYKGLKASGYEKEASMIRNAITKAYSELGFIPECYVVTKSNKIYPLKRADIVQAWSLCTIINFVHEKNF